MKSTGKILLSLLTLSLSLSLFSSPAQAQVKCNCESLWGAVNFSKKAEIQSALQTRLGGKEFCTTTADVCQKYCNSINATLQNADKILNNFPYPPVVNCTTGTAGTTSGSSGVIELKNPLGSQDMSVAEIINNIITAVLGFTGAVALLMFIYGGLLWLTSYGAADKVNKGKEVMVWATIGLVIIFSSYALVRFVFGAFSKI